MIRWVAWVRRCLIGTCIILNVRTVTSSGSEAIWTIASPTCFGSNVASAAILPLGCNTPTDCVEVNSVEAFPISLLKNKLLVNEAWHLRHTDIYLSDRNVVAPPIQGWGLGKASHCMLGYCICSRVGPWRVCSNWSVVDNSPSKSNEISDWLSPRV